MALRLPRVWRQAGYEVDLLCLDGEILGSSRFVDHVIQEATAEDLFQRLIGILRVNDARWQAVVVVDEQLVRKLIASGDRAVLENWQPGALDYEVGSFFLSKFGLEMVSKNPAMQIPPSRVCRTAEEIASFGESVGWPVILKPANGSGGTGVVRYDSVIELETKLPLPELPVLAQKFIFGKEGVVEMFCSAGRPLAWLASHSTRRMGGAFSYSTARMFLPKPELCPLVEQVARFTNFEGFCGFDWIRDENTGIHWMIEFHPRASAGLRFADRCGVDFSAAIVAAMTPGTAEFSPRVQMSGTSVAAHSFPWDLFRCLRDWDWRGLAMWLPGRNVHHDVFWDDSPLFKSWGRARFRELFRMK
ncbi:MAG: ATP-grasp domain-containing protein [Luteolibacter sp.]